MQNDYRALHTGNDMIRSVFLQDTIKTNDNSKTAEQ